MSKYTTGELAKLCGVSVRTVQYYDSRNILVPSELSEGGRRLYSQEDLYRMKIICFLREMGIPINSISQLLTDEQPEQVIDLLVEQQELVLQQEIRERQTQMEKLEGLKRGLKGVENFTVESIGDIANIMTNKQKLRKIRWTMILTGIPVTALQWGGIILWVMTGAWWLFAAWAVVAIPWGIVVSRYYFRKVAYLCPTCHKVFKPRFKEAFWANHTPTLRKLTCPCCGKKVWCVETLAEEMTQ